MPKQIDIEGSVVWVQKYIGKDKDGLETYEITHPSKYLTGAGAGTGVTATLKVRDFHIFDRIELKHTDSADADNTDAMTWSVKADFLEADTPIAVVGYTATTSTDFIEQRGLDYGVVEYTISIDTTANHRIRFKIFLKLRK